MLKQLIVSIMLAGSVYSPAFAADEFALLHEERIGQLRIDLPEAEVGKIIDCPLQQGPEELWGADGAYHQQWVYADCGLTLGMVSEKKGDPKTIESITLIRPGALTTRRGIRIGSTEQEVMKAYESSWNREDSHHFGMFVGGSIFGGLMFDFEKGKVSRIFLGAAAE